MTFESFATKRTGQQDRAIDRLAPLAAAWLDNFGSDDALGDLLDAATDVWLDTFESAAPEAYIDKAVGAFRDLVGRYLTKTTEPESPPEASQVRRVAVWLATVATNDATLAGFHASGGIRMRWVSRQDERTRNTHRAANGQIRNVTGTFDVGGAELRYPGDPKGPLAEVMECRCVLAPAGRVRTKRSGLQASAEYDDPETEEMDMTDTIDLDVEDPETEIGDDIDVTDEDMVDDPMIEIPVHGVATIEGKPTGDGRGFALGALTNRPLPLPMRYEFVGTHGGTTSDVAPVGRIDELWKVEVDGYVEYRFRGVIITTKAYANEAVEGIADGSLTGVSVETDDITVDVTEERERVRAMLTTQPASAGMAEGVDGEPSDEDIENFLDLMVGDGTQPVTMFSSARVCGFTIVPIPAFAEGYIALGPAFADELSDDDRAALEACGCYQPDDGDDTSVIRGEDAFREVPGDERKRLADKGEALPDGSFPIANVDDLKNAIQAIGRAKDPDAAKAHIKKRARALGHPELIPEDWSLLSRYAAATDPEERALLRRYMAAHAEAVVAAAFAPGTKDGPGWITHPRATARIRRYWTHGKGAAKIRWGTPGDFNRCRAQLAKYVQNPDWLAGMCANMHFEALKIWPGEHHNGRVITASAAAARSNIDPFMEFGTVEPVGLIAGAGWPEQFPAAAFRNPGFTEETPITFDGDLVYGHIATWNACHIGYDGICQNPPASRTAYRHFRKGVLDTDEGPVTVGALTFGTGHIGIRATAAQATAHYDKPDAVRAYVAVGEDAIGIWFAGVLKPGLSRADIAEFKALGAISGDWRWVKNDLELVGVTAVPVPGFQLARTTALVAAANGHQTALIPPPVYRHDLVPDEALEEAAMVASAANIVVNGGNVDPTDLARKIVVEMALEPRRDAVRSVREQLHLDRVERVRSYREA